MRMRCLVNADKRALAGAQIRVKTVRSMYAKCSRNETRLRACSSSFSAPKEPRGKRMVHTHERPIFLSLPRDALL